MALRKVQTDIERTLKEVVKGCDYFDEIHHKLLNADTQAKKDKSEDELKTQIKKLQRVRDQLKTWLATEEIREKDPLINARKNIESRMELFKRAEKESKTKAFSKEGLSQAEKLDPEMQAIVQCMQWANDSLDKIRSQKELAEADLETLQQQQAASGKAGKKASAQQLQLKEDLDLVQERLRNHQFHIHNLELVLRGLDNGMIPAVDVNDICESVEDYVQFNSEPDHIFDDAVYEQLELDTKLGVIGKEVDGNAAPAVEEGGGRSAAQSTTTTAAQANKRKTAAAAPASGSGGGAGGGGAGALAASSEAEDKAVELRNKQDAQLKKEQERQRLISSREETKKKRREEELAAAAEAQAQAQAQAAALAAAPPPPAPPAPVVVPVVAAPVVVVAATPTPSPPAVVSPPPGLPEPVAVASVASTPSPAPAATTTTGLLPVLASPVPPALPLATDSAQRLFLLESSLHFMPRAVESERAKLFVPQTALPTSQAQIREFPQAPRLETAHVFERMDLESLFFIFYHQPGTVQQFLAARELKLKEWRFHKQHAVWMQRYEDPTQATSEYEMGTFVYFDPVLWEQRVKVNFTVEFRELEK